MCETRGCPFHDQRCPFHDARITRARLGRHAGAIASAGYRLALVRKWERRNGRLPSQQGIAWWWRAGPGGTTHIIKPHGPRAICGEETGPGLPIERSGPLCARCEAAALGLPPPLPPGPCACPVAAVRRWRGGRVAGVHLAAARPIAVRLATWGPAWQRQPGQWLCAMDGRPRVSEPAPGAAVTCTRCIESAARYGVTVLPATRAAPGLPAA